MKSSGEPTTPLPSAEISLAPPALCHEVSTFGNRDDVYARPRRAPGCRHRLALRLRSLPCSGVARGAPYESAPAEPEAVTSRVWRVEARRPLGAVKSSAPGSGQIM